MPYVFNFEQQDWNEERPPPADRFQYLPPPALDGRRSPVSFKADAGGLSVSEPEPGGPPAKKGFLARLFGAADPQSRADPVRYDYGPFLSLLMPRLFDLGMVKAICRYDGGNDEGFAWLDGIELRDGRKLSCAKAVASLGDSGVAAALAEASLAMRNPKFTYDPVDPPALLLATLRDEFPSMLAALLLGEGYGTGAYAMYGTFVVDFDKGTITDDPAAPAVVENIEISGQR